MIVAIKYNTLRYLIKMQSDLALDRVGTQLLFYAALYL